MNNKKWVTPLTRTTKILTVALAWIVGLFTVVSTILLQPDIAEIVTGRMGIQTTQVVELDGDDADPLEYYKTEFNSIQDLQEEASKVVEDIVAEGAVLLKNDSGLPLAKGSTVSLFDITCVDPVWGGTGSGNAKVSGMEPHAGKGPYTKTAPTYKKAFEDAGLDVNDELWNWYNSSTSAKYKRVRQSSWPNSMTINGASWTDMNTTAKEAPADAAIFILGRIGGEDHDRDMLTWNESGNSKTEYLKLSDKEETVLAKLKELKGTKFGKLILLINSSNQPELDFLTEDQYGFDAALWIGGVGESGLNAVGKILTGDVNPSGRLTSMYWNQHVSNPVHANFGSYEFDSQNVHFDAQRPATADQRYVVYQEGMYLGYRYAETRYEDVVLGRTNAGSFDYNDVVAYPFGHGLSYTQFEYSKFEVKTRNYRTDPVRPQANRVLDKTEYTVTLDVKNAGSKAGKEVVQIYMQRPYTSYDMTNGIEKPSVELVGFVKTPMIPAGGTVSVSVKVDEKYFAAYDANGAGTYVLTGGDYYLAAGRNAHEALKNILDAKGKATVYDRVSAAGNQNFAEKLNPNGAATATPNMEKYKYSDATGNEIENLFDFADLNRYEGKGTNSVNYMSRNNWAGTVSFVNPVATVNRSGNSVTVTNQTTQVRVTKTEKMKADMLGNRSLLERKDGEFPFYAESWKSLPPSERIVNIPLAEMALKKPDGTPIYAYDDPKWEEFLDQLSWDDYLALLSDGKRKTAPIDSVAKPRTLDHNGPIGFIHPYYDTAVGIPDPANPSSNLSNTSWSGLDKQSGHGGLSELGVDPVTKLPNRAVYGKEATPDPDKHQYPTAFPSNPVVGSTYNVEIAQRAGEILGEDGLWGGYNGVYGTGVNLHRTPYQGRAFEYYGEDGFLSGVIAASWTRGCQSKGVYVYNKHLALNEQEYGRFGISTFVNEQTFRELYLRAFEIPIVSDDAKAIMGALNRVGVLWASSCEALNTDWLRGEAGFTGFTVTDWWDPSKGADGEYYMQVAQALLSGNDLPDGVLSTDYLDRYKPGGTNANVDLAWAMRESAHRILYTTAQSNVMNGFTVNTRVITITPGWIGVMETFQWLLWIPLVLCAAGFITLTILTSIWKKRDNETA